MAQRIIHLIRGEVGRGVGGVVMGVVVRNISFSVAYVLNEWSLIPKTSWILHIQISTKYLFLIKLFHATDLFL